MRPDSIREGKHRVYIFERPGHLMQHIESNPQTHENAQSEETGAHMRKWSGTDSIEHAKRLFIEGWHEGVVEMQNVTEDIERTLLDRIPRPEMRHDVTGAEVDITAYMAGEPECMLDWHTHPQNDLGIRIVVNGTFSGGMDQRIIKSRGAAVVAFIHALQLLDIPAELWGYWAVDTHTRKHGMRKHEVWCRISRPGYEVDIERVAFMLAHPSMLRRIMFALWEREPSQIRRDFRFRPSGGYGGVREWPASERGEHDLYLPGMTYGDGRWGSAAKAVEWILDELGKHGVELID